MSKEIQVSFDCEHTTIEEIALLDSTKTKLESSQPIVSKNNVKVKANFSEIPSFGLRTTAELVSFYSGPFFIEATARLLEVKNSKEVLSVSLPVGERVATNKVVAEINKNAKTLFATNIKGHLAVTDLSETGENSVVQISGNAIESFGFHIQSEARGVTVFPSWSLKDGVIVFSSRIKENPVFHLSYITERQFCKRCQGSGRELDPRIDSKGRYIEIENENLLYQAALKILLTERGTNPYHPWYGSTLQSKIGSKAILGIASSIREDVRNTLINLQRLQQEQGKYQPVSLKEKLYRVLSTEVLQNNEDPTVFLINVEVQNASLEAVSLSILYSTTNILEF